MSLFHFSLTLNQRTSRLHLTSRHVRTKLSLGAGGWRMFLAKITDDTYDTNDSNGHRQLPGLGRRFW